MRSAVDATWNTDVFERKERYEAWNQRLNDVYGSWNLTGLGKPDFNAELSHRSDGNLTFADCACDPCGAVRKKGSAGQSHRDMLAIQLVLSGREHFTIDGKTTVLGPGDVLVWNTTRSMSFEVVERLHKISVIMPLSRLRSWLPNSWYSLENSLPNGSEPAGLLASLIKSVSPSFLSGTLQNGEALTEAVIGMLISSLSIDRPAVESSTLRDAQLLRVKTFINAHLDDPDLSPTAIAAANGISVRYLHCLFEPEGITVLQYVIRERLVRCRRELANPAMARRTITEIAFAWGFQSSTHFSRRFKEEYGLSPHEFRHEAFPTAQDGPRPS